MGTLGDKMLKAGVVTQEDAERVRRQETIRKENERKAELAREAKEREREKEQEREEFLYNVATKVATVAVRSCALQALGFSEEEARLILLRDPLHDSPLPLELVMRVGEAGRDIIALTHSDISKEALAEERDRLLKDPEFRKTVLNPEEGKDGRTRKNEKG